MNRFHRLIFPLTFALALFAASMQVGAVPIVVHTGTSATASSESDDSASSGRAVAVMASTRIEYIPALRVWYDTAGNLLVCRAPGETYTYSSKRCELAGNKDVNAGWAALAGLRLAGHELSSVQVNETQNGPSLVLYWRAAPAKALKP